jgi:hypothetical protein
MLTVRSTSNCCGKTWPCRWLLFVGCWQTFWNDGQEYPVCFGTEDESPKVKGAFQRAFRKVYKNEAIPFEKWTMGWVPEEDFSGPDDPVEKIWGKLELIWKAVSKAAGDKGTYGS